MKEKYIDYTPNQKTAGLIDYINQIVYDYQEQGYSLTLRQVYYQLVSRDVIPNNERSYKNLGSLINNARLGGFIDWNAITDRTRFLRKNSHWESPQEIISSCAYQFAVDRWKYSDTYVEVWVEKDALVDIVGQICSKFDCPYLACRGYMSASEMYSSAQRFKDALSEGKECHLIHLGDHDPSGIDMTRDINERLNDVFQVDVQVHRIALTMEQIEKYTPPPNPTKVTDTRSNDYIKKYGHTCWELDALEPSVITNLIETNIKKYMDITTYFVAEKKEEKAKKNLKYLSKYYSSCVNLCNQIENLEGVDFLSAKDLLDSEKLLFLAFFNMYEED